MEIALCKAKCASCGAEFSQPELGDFAYGAFVFTGERGTVHAYFEVFEVPAPVWNFLEDVLPQPHSGELLQGACAHFADPVTGQRLSNKFICPKCQSSNLAYWGGERTGFAEVPEASFSQFMGLPKSERRRLALEFYRRFKAK